MKNEISFQQLRATHETEDSDTGADDADANLTSRAEVPHR